jgi:ABC-2 type transport system permease protein
MGLAQIRAVVWAQWRSIWNFYPRASRGGVVFTVAGSALWYGMCAFAAVAAAFFFASAANLELFPRVLRGGLFVAFLYCQVVPLLLVSTGISLDLKKLLVYPIPQGQLFALEVLLRVSVAIEVLVIIAGAGLGLAANPRVPLRGLGGLALFAAFNLFLSTGLRDLLKRLLARRRVRELAVLLLVLAAALPQLLILGGVPAPLRRLAASEWPGIAPWTAAAGVTLGGGLAGWAALLLWTAAAWGFGRWQFARTIAFDEREAGAAPVSTAAGPRLLDRLLGWPSAIFADPLGALLEKEIRFLTRAPRFRLVFVMGFSFGLLIWLPLAFGGGRGSGSVFTSNYLTFVSAYALVLLGEVTCFNAFGFDRAAAQAYYVLPVRFRQVLAAKNLAAAFFVLTEVSAVAIVCALLGMPVSGAKLAEAYAVIAVLGIHMLAVGNLSSTHFPRAVDPSQSWRSGGMGRFQAMLLLIYPLLAAPIALAYLARYAFQSSLAFYGVLGMAAAIGGIVYWVAMDSAVSAAEQRKERILATLGQGQGPIAG